MSLYWWSRSLDGLRIWIKLSYRTSVSYCKLGVFTIIIILRDSSEPNWCISVSRANVILGLHFWQLYHSQITLPTYISSQFITKPHIYKNIACWIKVIYLPLSYDYTSSTIIDWWVKCKIRNDWGSFKLREMLSKVVDEQGKRAYDYIAIADKTFYHEISQSILPSGLVINCPYRDENMRASIR